MVNINLNFQDLDQVHVVDKRDLRHSIVNIKLHKCQTDHFCTSYYHLQEINILTFDIKNWGQGNLVEKRNLRHLIVNLHKSHREHFCASSHGFLDIHI